MPALSLSLFGPFEARFDGQSVTDFRSVKAQALLIYLAAERGRPHRRESLFTLLWPGMPESSARHNLRQALYALRQIFPEVLGGQVDHLAPLIIADRKTVQLNPAASIEVDLHQMDYLLESTKGHDHRHLGACERCLQALQDAAALYRGDFLAGFYLEDSNQFEDWAEANREAYRRKTLDVLAELAEIGLQKADYEGARRYADRQLEIDPLRERAYRQLMELLSKTGQRAEALQAYQRCVRILESELGASPSSETNALYEIISAEGGLKGDFALGSGFIRGYEIREQLGSGGLGIVYRAYQPIVHRDVAIKVIQPQFASHPDFIRRFEVEAQLTARLEHPNIVPIYDFWRDPTGAYLVMRWLKGGNLSEGLTRGPWKPLPALHLVEQIAAGLHFAHGQGIVHCDVKPANIILDEEGNAYLSDFGLAILIGPLGQLSYLANMAGGEDFTGSLGYSSPEAARGQDPTPLADVYSLGVVVYELLTGVHPFPGIAGAALMEAHRTAPLPFVRDLHPELPQAVDAVIQRATAKDPAERYPDALSLARALRRSLLGETAQASSIEPGEDLAARNPYKGLRAFQQADARDFFGRENLIQRLLARLSLADGSVGHARFLALVGPSGSGKSSVIHAGLLPALRQGALPGSARWFVVESSLGQDPFGNLANALLQIAAGAPVDLEETLRGDDRGLVSALQAVLPAADSQALLVIDQFEELFTLVEEETDRDRFLDLLARAATEPGSPVRVLVTLRADFYDRPLRHSAIGELMRSATELVLPLTAEELERAINGPAEGVGVELAPALAARLVRELTDQPGTLPLLQYTLTELFDRRQGSQIGLDSYQESGGVLGALGRRAEDIYHNLAQGQQEAARHLFLRMVTLGEGTEDVRRRVLRSELAALDFDLHPLEVFGRYRLLTFDHDPVSRSPTVEVAHEALLREWPRLRAWLDESRADVRYQRLLNNAASDWRRSGEDADFLLRGSRLDQFKAWAGETDLALTTEEQAFLDASIAERRARQAAEAERRAHEARLEQRSRRFLRALVGVFAAAALIALLLSGIAFNQRGIAQENLILARAGELGSTAMSVMERQLDLALLLSVEAYRQSSTLQNWTSLYAVGTYNPQLQRVMRGHMGRVECLDYSPDGKALASGGVDGSVRLWDMDPASPTFSTSKIMPHDLESPVFESVAFSSEGSLLAASSSDGHVLVWDVDTRSSTFGRLLKVHVTEELAPGRTWVSFSPTAPILAAVPNSGQVELFNMDLESSEFGERLAGVFDGSFFSSLALSPKGDILAAGEIMNGYVYLWHLDYDDPKLGYEMKTLGGFDSCVETLAFSSDGNLLAAGLCDETIWLWDMNPASPTFGEHLTTLEGQEWIVLNIAISPDGSRLASAGGWDDMVMIWDINPQSASFGKPVGTPLKRGGFVDSVAYSPGDGTLAVGAADGGIFLWDMNQEGIPLAERDAERNLGRVKTSVTAFPHPLETMLSGHAGIIESVAFSPDGRYLASASGGSRDMGGGKLENHIRLWDVDPTSRTFGSQIGKPLRGHTAWVSGLAYHPDGTRLATSSGDRTVRLWDVDPQSQNFGREIGEPWEGHVGELLDIAYSPDGRIIASTDTLGMVYLWDADPNSSTFGTAIADPIEAGSDMVEGIAFSPDGAFLATGPLGEWNWGQNRYDAIRLWDTNLDSPNFGNLVVELWGGHTAGVRRVAFSPDGMILASASDDETIRLWDVDPDSPTFGQTIGAPLFAGYQLLGLAFSPDGSHLVSGTIEGGVIHMWDVDPSSPSFGQPLGVPLNQEDVYVVTIAYSPKGNYFAVGDYDFQIHLWNVDPDAWIAYNCKRAGRNLTEAEWNRYLSWAGPFDPEYKTCPQWPAGE